jgi:hypothetical protein
MTGEMSMDWGPNGRENQAVSSAQSEQEEGDIAAESDEVGYDSSSL